MSGRPVAALVIAILFVSTALLFSLRQPNGADRAATSGVLEIEAHRGDRKAATRDESARDDIASRVGHGDASEAARVPANEWSIRFHSESDYWQFANDAVAAAMDGDARAQYLLAAALRSCRSTIGLYSALYGHLGVSPAEMFRMNTASLTNLSASDISRRQKEFSRCERFFETDPLTSAGLPLREGGYPPDYWLDLAMENNEPLAHIEHVYDMWRDLGSTGEATAAETRQRIKDSLEIAARSADPEALHRIGYLLSFPGRAKDLAEGSAWLLAACELGLDCSITNPIVGQDCQSYGTCSEGDSLPQMMQVGLGRQYGVAYARAQEIAYAYREGDVERVIQELLDQLEFQP